MRYLRRDVIVHDASYHECIEVTGPLEHVVATLNTLATPALPRHLRCNREHRTVLMLADASQCLGRARAIFNPLRRDGVQCWLFMHPAHAPQALAELTRLFSAQPSCTVNSLRRQLNRIELRGPLTHALLHHVFRVEASCVSPAQLAAWRALQHMGSPAQACAGAVLGVVVVDPRLQAPRPLSRHQNDAAPPLAVMEQCAKVRAATAIFIFALSTWFVAAVSGVAAAGGGV